MKICPDCGEKNPNKSFCTNCGFDISNVEPVEVRKKREEKERQEELERKEREQRERELKLERKEREQKNKEFELKNNEYKQKRKQFELERKEHDVMVREQERGKRKSRLKIIGVLIIIILLLGVVLYFQINDGTNNQEIPDLNNDNQDTVDESITPQNNEENNKKVDFNGLFTMYVAEDSEFVESTPQLDATYQWDTWGYNVRYYNQYDDINQLVSMYLKENPTLNYSTEGNLFILDNYGFTDYSVDTQGFVGVQSQDNKIVVISGREDLNILKTLANSIVFE